jgi:hypothetical protein
MANSIAIRSPAITSNLASESKQQRQGYKPFGKGSAIRFTEIDPLGLESKGELLSRFCEDSTVDNVRPHSG